ncbi:MAG TPA: adenylate kinase [Microthrixaceae bacterium]|nr:adenylate kinase [Microthrixaceae bacterium]
MASCPRLIVFGRQGAGKGTQCARLAEHYRVPHISTGDMLRAAVRDGTEFGRKAKEYMDSGLLLPDDIMVGLVGERLAEPDAADGWILDGFPRTPGQADDLRTLVADRPIDLAINLEVPEDVVVERISSRRVCTQCGTNYSAADESGVTGVCAKCGGQVVQRDDDTEAAVRERLALYNEQTAPLLGWFEDQDLLVTVDGVGDADDIFAALVELIDARTAG